MATDQTTIIHVAACCDENYAPFTTVMMVSAMEHLAEDCQLHFHFVSNDVSESTLEQMATTVAALGGQLTVYKADPSQFEGLPTLRFGSAVYQRILLADYLPSEVHRVIYIDADTLVTADLKELWETDLEGLPLAAVEDLSHSACKTIGVPRIEYFNSGVLVMDLDLWRSENIHGKVAQYAGENAHRLKYVDQCSLNAVLHERWKVLPPKWNQQANIYKVLRKYSKGSNYSKTLLRQAVAFPAITHFTGKKKPWLYYCFHPSKPLYRSYLEKTPWAGRYPPAVSLQEKLRYWVAPRQHYKWLSRSTKIFVFRSLTALRKHGNKP